jgi:hypothetical protein
MPPRLGDIAALSFNFVPFISGSRRRAGGNYAELCYPI